jgi:hypothetical protein
MQNAEFPDELSEAEKAEPERSIKRLFLAGQDMAESRAAAEFLLSQELPGDVRRALETAIPVAYARPWGRTNTIGALCDHWFPPREDLKRLHDALILARNKVYAHTDEEMEARGITDVSDIVGQPGPIFATSWNPLNPELLPAIVDLTLLQEQRFNRGALLLQRRLRDERATEAT